MISNRIRSYAVVMMLLTTAYLIVELSFNASLLDVTGQATSPEEVERIEVFGRCISATAVVLAIFGSLLKKRFLLQSSTAETMFKTMIMIIIVFPLVFVGERDLIEFFVDRSDGEQRKNALWMSYISRSLLDGEIHLDGVEFTAGEKSKPEDKAFISLLPLWGAAAEDITKKAESLMPHIVKKTTANLAGKPNEFYNEAYLGSIKSINKLYNEKYVEGSNRYAKAVAASQKEADKAWKQYVKKLAQKGLKPHTVPSYGRARVREDVRSAGVPVSDNWRPDDRHGFYAAVTNKIKSGAKDSFDSQIKNIVGIESSLPPGLSWSKFIRTNAVQELWRSKLKMPSNVVLTDKMSPAQFEKAAYRPMVDSIAKKTLRELHLSSKNFESEEKYSHLGEDAYRSAIVAPIALGFSMIGGFVHIVKLLNFTLLLGIPFARVRKVIVTAALVFFIVYPTTIETKTTSSRLISNLSTQASDNILAKTRAEGLTWIMKTQTIFYPLNDTVREKLFGGFDFQI